MHGVTDPRRLRTPRFADAHATYNCSDGEHFSFAGCTDSVSVEAIYGTVDQLFERETGLRETGLLDGVPRLLRFAISAAALERAIGLVTEQGRPPRVVESSSEESSDSGDEAAQLASPVRLLQGRGRAVPKRNYRE